MATVRMYKVAELLGMSSPEAIALLKQDTGIDVKSASSSIEEIVARQFVERHARRRQITLPHGPLFAETAAQAHKPGGKTTGKAPVEPVKPAAPALRPRLIKTIKPVVALAPEGVEELPVSAPEPEAPLDEPMAPAVEAVAADELLAVSEPDVEVPAPAAAAPAPPVETRPAVPSAPVVAPPRPSRLVPPTRRLRIEDPVTGEAPAARPIAPRTVVRPQPAPPQQARPAGSAPAVARPGGLRPMTPSVRPPLGGPRPLPSQPIRPSSPLPGRPGGVGPRPPFRPAAPRPRTGPRRDDRPSMAMPAGSAAADYQAHHPGGGHDGEGFSQTSSSSRPRTC